MTTTALNTKTGEVENKIPHINDLVKKTDYNSKISDIEAKYFIIFYKFNINILKIFYNKFTNKIFEKKIKEKK